MSSVKCVGGRHCQRATKIADSIDGVIRVGQHRLASTPIEELEMLKADIIGERLEEQHVLRKCDKSRSSLGKEWCLCVSVGDWISRRTKEKESHESSRDREPRVGVMSHEADTHPVNWRGTGELQQTAAHNNVVVKAQVKALVYFSAQFTDITLLEDPEGGRGWRCIVRRKMMSADERLKLAIAVGKSIADVQQASH
eukprot:Gb_36201 [translate_table: standard]